jgi:hypothetical protein
MGVHFCGLARRSMPFSVAALASPSTGRIKLVMANARNQSLASTWWINNGLRPSFLVVRGR